MPLVKPIVKLIKALCTNTAPGEIAHAFACGVILGFMPKNNVLWFILFIFVFFLRIQRGVFSLAVIIASAFAPFLDPTFHQVGGFILTQEKLIPFYIKLLETPFVSFTKFNNTIVMGSLVCGLLAYIPLYILSRLFTRLWRFLFAAKIKNIRLFKAFLQLPIVTKAISFAEDL